MQTADVEGRGDNEGTYEWVELIRTLCDLVS